jgi:hypothetical protein
MRGWVYVIENDAMRGIVKVGFSTKDPALRAAELSTTGVPHPFRVIFDALVESPREVEQKTHRDLAEHREGKEWFRCDVLVAVNAIRANALDKGLLLERWSTHGAQANAEINALLAAADRAYEAGGDSARFPFVVKAAELGDLASLAEISAEYEFRDGPLFDLDKAQVTRRRLVELAKARSQLGDSEARLWLARCFREGWGTPADPDQALGWFAAAANGELYKQALYEGGRLLLMDARFSSRRQEGVEWLEKSGHPLGFMMLAGIYERGEIVARNLEAAIRFMERLRQFMPENAERHLRRLQELREQSLD